MNRPRLVIRLDIDTIVCMRPGVENLLALARKKGVRFTFFANMGRAICYRSSLQKLIRISSGFEDNIVPKLSSMDKLGLKGLLVTLAFNPRVGNRYPDILMRIVNEGHDLGLHGGKNHGDWHHNAGKWGAAKVKEEVEWGISEIESIGLPKPVMFASPGFTTPRNITHILTDLGFIVLADRHAIDQSAISVDRENPSFKYANTRLLGRPGAVGYVETIIAGGVNFNEVKKQLTAYLDEGDDVILYDHPCLVGVRGINHISHIIDIWTDAGGKLSPLSELLG